MKPVAIGTVHSRAFGTDQAHSAETLGNLGVDVVSSEALIRFVETACYDIIQPCFDAGEASVGVGFNLTHLAPARIGTSITVTARLVAIDGRKYDFETEAYDGARLVMTGTHRRAIIDLARFMKDNAT